jgi:hypothetical protein
MTDDPLDQLSARLFAAGRNERPGQEFQRRLDGLKPASSRRPRKRAALLPWLSAAALLALAGAVILLETDAAQSVTLSREPALERAEPPARAAEPATRASENGVRPAVPLPAEPIDEPRRRAPPQLRPPTVRTTQDSGPRAAPIAATPAPDKTAAAPVAPSLAAELALLESARRALRAGDAQGALDRLDRHSSEAPSSSLGAEATLLRLEALQKLGRTRDASTLAADFVAVNPNNPLSDRARKFILATGARGGD